jgi:PAS domain S-box-containing protein
MQNERTTLAPPVLASSSRGKSHRLAAVALRFAGRCIAGAGATLAFALGAASTSAAAGARPDQAWHSLGRWQQAQGLPQNTVFSLLQTGDGYIWIGTRAGVARFDGVSFATFDNRDPSKIRDNEVWTLAEADDHSLWIGTYGGGVSRLADGKFTIYTKKDGLAGDFVTVLLNDRHGGMWIATDTGVSHFAAGRFTNYTVQDGLSLDIIRALYLDEDDSLWVGTMKGGVQRIKDGKITGIDLGPQPPTSEIRVIYRDASHAFWVGTTTEGLLKIQDGHATWYNEKTGLPSNRVMCVHEDRNGNFWIGTSSGLVRYKGGRFTVQPLGEQATHGDYIMALAEDHEGSLWAGTADRGLVCLRRAIFEYYTMDDGLPDEYAAAIIQDHNGDILIGTRKGVSVLRNGVITPYGQRNGLPEISLLGLMCDRDGTIWICTEDGLYRSAADERNTAGEHIFQRLEGNGDSIRHISARLVFKDDHGAVWIGTTMEGLVKLDHGQYTTYTRENGLPSNAIRGLEQDRDGTLWIATRGGGLVSFRDGKFKTYTEADGLPSDILQVLYLDHEGTLWIGTRQGLGRLQNGKFTKYTVNDGLFVNYVSGISEDRRGNLWLSGANGMSRVSIADFTAVAEGKAKTIRSIGYGAEHGLSSTVGSVGVLPSVYTANDGRVWFGTFNGANVVNPADITINELPPPVHITSVTIDRQAFPLRSGAEAAPGRGDLGFLYSGVSFLAPEKMQFKYRLDGYDLDWIEAGSRREAYYSNIPPGNYTFRVIAANSDGVWNETGASITFRLRPHVYQTGWFRGLLVLLAAGGIAGAFRLRVRRLRRRSEQLRRQNVELERRIAERTAELSKSYEALRASEYFYQSLVESLPQMILRKDHEGRVTYCNAPFAELLHCRPDEVVGRTEDEFYPSEVAAKFRADDLRIMESHQRMEFQTVVEVDGRKRYLQVKKVPLYDENERPIGVQVLFWDTTAFRETEEQLKETQRELIEISRLAGIAEIATGVLHNLGNVLNSVNTSTTLAAEGLRKLKIPSLRKVVDLLEAQGARLAEFVANDPRGRKVPEFLAALCSELEAEQQKALQEIAAVRDAVEHIKEIVAAQQSYTQVSGITEVMAAAELLEYALRINEASLRRHQITVSREIMTAGAVNLPRGKTLQILNNLIRNAKQALTESGRADKRLTLGARAAGDDRVQFYVSDNGSGVAPENLPRLFTFGFTTKKSGHGFGLHSSALAAKELGGTLIAQSEGIGKGATFILDLPTHRGGPGDEPAVAPAAAADARA